MSFFGSVRRFFDRYGLQFVRIACYFGITLLLCSWPLALAASASDLDDIPYTSVDTGEDQEEYVQLPAGTFLDLIKSDSEDPEEEVIVRNVGPVTPAETSGLQSIILSLIGDYDPVVVEHRYTNSSGYTSVSIDVSPDYSWIASCSVFAIVVFCTFRLIGGIICGKH